MKTDTTPVRTIQYTERDCKDLRKSDPKNVALCNAKGFECHYAVPYGFVIEAGCPYHD